MAGLNYNKNSTKVYDIKGDEVTTPVGGFNLLGLNSDTEIEAFISVSKVKDYIDTNIETTKSNIESELDNDYVSNDDLNSKVSDCGYIKMNSVTNYAYSKDYIDNEFSDKATHWESTSVGAIKPIGNAEVHAPAFYADSDKTLKTNIHEVTEDSIKDIDKLNIVEFDWKSNNAHSIGMIAQDVEKLFPYLVRDGETKTVNYVPLLLLKIASLEKRVKELENKNGVN